MAIDQFGQVDRTNNSTPSSQNNSFFKQLLTFVMGILGIGALGFATIVVANVIQSFSNDSPTLEVSNETTTLEVSEQTNTPEVSEQTNTPEVSEQTNTHEVPEQINIREAPSQVNTIKVSESTNNYSPSCYQEVDRIFYQRHPELQGKSLSQDDTNLLNEWLEIRNSLTSCLNQNSQQSNSNKFYAVTNIHAENPFNFPQNTCGDFIHNGSFWYPIFVRNDGNNFSIIKSEYCRDAILNYREIKGENYIQVASFTSYEKATQFVQILQQRFDNVEIGKPNK